MYFKTELILSIMANDYDYSTASLCINKIFIMLSTYTSCTCGMVLLLILSNKKLIKKNFKNKKKLNLFNINYADINLQVKELLHSKGNFLLSISHELRNPLNCILGYIDLALEELSERKVKEFLGSARVSGQILLLLITNLIDSSKLENNSLEIVKTHTKIDSFIQNAWTTMKGLIKRVNLQGELLVSKNMPDYIDIDSNRLSQIMFNLVSNATKYTQNGSIKIIVKWIDSPNFSLKMMDPTNFDTTKNYLITNSELPFPLETHFSSSIEIPHEFKVVDEFANMDRSALKPTVEDSNLEYDIFHLNNSKQQSLNDLDTKKRSLDSRDHYHNKAIGFLKIEVSDTGCGMNEDTMADLFKKFQKDGNKRLGAGLSLWITSHLCKIMDGCLKVFSLVNEGTTIIGLIRCEGFSSSLPYIEINSVQNLKQINISLKPTALIVDDLKFTQESVKKILEKVGIETKYATSNFSHALATYKLEGEGYFDFVIMALKLNENKELAKQIRLHENIKGWNPSILVLLKDESQYMIKLENDIEKITKTDFIFKEPFKYCDCLQILHEYQRRKNLVLSNFKCNESKKMRVLLIDNRYSSLERDILRHYLYIKGYKFIPIDNQQDILSTLIVNNEKISSIIINCDCDDLNIMQICSKIKEFCLIKKINLITMVGLTSQFNQKVLENKYKKRGIKKFLWINIGWQNIIDALLI